MLSALPLPSFPVVLRQAHLENKRYQQLRIAERFTRADGSEMLYIGRDSIMPGQAAWPLPHDAPYRPVIDRLLMAIIEVFILELLLLATPIRDRHSGSVSIVLDLLRCPVPHPPLTYLPPLYPSNAVSRRH